MQVFETSLRADADLAVAQRGKQERELLQPGEELIAVQQKRAKSVEPAGFGGMGAAKPAASTKKKKGAKGAKKGGAKKAAKPVAQARMSTLAQEMKDHGVARINNVLSPETVVALRDFVDAERAQAIADVEAGNYDQASRFADLVLLSKRCDLLMPLRGPSITALDELLMQSDLGPLLSELVGDDATLQEIACLISEPGSSQQPLHPDTPYSKIPTLYACFVALQDVELEMGPTVYLPGTHTQECHELFYGGDISLGRDMSGLRTPPINEAFFQARPVKLGLLKAGDCALYNQQVLHCGSANESPDPTKLRRQFYISVRNPAVPVKARASIRPAFRNKLTLGEIRQELKLLDGKTERVAEDGSFGLFGELDRLDAQYDETKRDRHQAGSLYRSLEKKVDIQ